MLDEVKHKGRGLRTSYPTHPRHSLIIFDAERGVPLVRQFTVFVPSPILEGLHVCDQPSEIEIASRA
jgi:hypothetical protein